MHEPAVGNHRRLDCQLEGQQPAVRPTAGPGKWRPPSRGKACIATGPLPTEKSITFLWAISRSPGNSILRGHERFLGPRHAHQGGAFQVVPAIDLLRVADPKARTFGLELAAFSREAIRLAWSFASDGGITKSGTLASQRKLVAAGGTALDFDKVRAKGQPVGSFRIRVTSADGGKTDLDWASARGVRRPREPGRNPSGQQRPHRGLAGGTRPATTCASSATSSITPTAGRSLTLDVAVFSESGRKYRPGELHDRRSGLYPRRDPAAGAAGGQILGQADRRRQERRRPPARRAGWSS